MQVAFIPPKGLVHYAERGDIVMCLAQLLNNENDTQYTEAMTRLSKEKFLLLDNGANEGRALSNQALAEAARCVQADEVVLPDVLGNSKGTYAAATDFLKYSEKYSVSYMGVVQGTTFEELHNLVDMYTMHSGITTLGLPRLLLDKFSQDSIRIDLAQGIEELYPKRFKIHFLGASSRWIKEPYFTAKYAPFVRSIDTSAPFNYGLEGVCIDRPSRPIDRPEDYFTKRYALTGRTTIMHNIKVYKEWCNGETTPTV